MITKYKYIHFIKEHHTLLGYELWVCKNNQGKNYLGFIEYVNKWGEFQYVPENNTAYTHECCTDIADFLQQLNAGGT